MVGQKLAGSRIRERRLDRGLRQAAVAETVGISASYLNLIEHNRRRIGGKLLTNIARVLEVEPALLIEGADTETLDGMRTAASVFGKDVEVARAEELAARYPGWATLIADQAQRIAALQAQVQALGDRMAHDPQLSGALHDVITAVSGIRSTAAILVGPEDLDADWQKRFHQNIHDDSLRLAASGEAIVALLAAPEADLAGAAAPTEQVWAWLAQTGFHVTALEDERETPQSICAAAGLGPAATSILLPYLTRYAADVAALPMGRFAKLARDTGYDPSQVALQTGARFDQVLRRLASLPAGEGHPPIGLAQCDASGTLQVFKQIAGFALPRFGGTCPLWPVFSALARPEQPFQQDVVLPDGEETRLRCFAVSNLQALPHLGAPPTATSTMIVVAHPPDHGPAPLPIGISCRICPRMGCESRREPALTGVAPG